MRDIYQAQHRATGWTKISIAWKCGKTLPLRLLSDALIDVTQLLGLHDDPVSISHRSIMTWVYYRH
jgi:hypothetical protein